MTGRLLGPRASQAGGAGTEEGRGHGQQAVPWAGGMRPWAQLELTVALCAVLLGLSARPGPQAGDPARHTAPSARSRTWCQNRAQHFAPCFLWRWSADPSGPWARNGTFPTASQRAPGSRGLQPCGRGRCRRSSAHAGLRPAVFPLCNQLGSRTELLKCL